MAIDITLEDVISVTKATELVPSCRDDRPTHPTRLIRAIQKGELDGLRFGRQWVTSVQAIQRWGERQAAGKVQAAPATSATAPAAPRTPAARRKAIAKAQRDFETVGT